MTPAQKSNLETGTSKEKWVLIVEDDFLISKAFSAKLAHDNIPHKLAGDGEEALATLKSGPPPALVLLDLMLPKKNGFAVLEEMKKDSKLKSVPVIILTNLGQAADTERGMKLGAAEYLVKATVKIEDVVKKIHQYLSQQ